jgi:hypothetical protein
MRLSTVILLFVLLFFAQSYCGNRSVAPKTTYHIVKRNESARQISELYNVPLDSIKKWNYLDRNYRVIQGMRLIIKHQNGFLQKDNARLTKQLNTSIPKALSPSVKFAPEKKKTPATIESKTKDTLTSSSGQIAFKGLDSTLEPSKKTQPVDSAQTASQSLFLPLLSDPVPQNVQLTFFQKAFHFYIDSSYLIKAIIFLNLFFLISSIFLALWLIYRRLKLEYIKYKKMKCQDRYRDFITDWLYEEHKNSVPVSLIKELKDSIYRDVFTSELLSLHNNLTGESAQKLIELYHLAGFRKYSIQKVRRSFWNIKAKGFRELAQMRIKENSMIFKYLNSGNVTLSIEAQLAWIQLNPEDPLSFYDDPNVKLTEWGQLNLLIALKKSERVPDFGRWLKSASKSVSLFALKMAGIYKQFENVDLVAERLDDNDQDIRREAIRALGKLALPSQAKALQKLYPNEDLENKTEIVQALTMLIDPSNVSFFEAVLLNETDINIRILAAKGLISLGEAGNNKLDSIFLTDDPTLRKIIIHAKDDRI